MELAAIITVLLAAVGALVVLAGLVLRAWAAGRPGGRQEIRRLAAGLAGRLGRLTGHYNWRWTGYPWRWTGGLRPEMGTLVLRLLLGLAAIAAAAVGAGTLVDDVTDGDGVALLDHPVARFVAAHRAAPLTSVMKAVSTIGGPAGMPILALAAGLLLGLAWRSWMPLAVLAVTAAGVSGLTAVIKAALGRARPPLAQAVAAADGYGFPSGHAAAAAAVCGAAAWLCSMRMRSWRGRIAVWAAAAMLATLAGIARVYLGVHWTSDVVGGWAFGILWVTVVVGSWTALGHLTGTATSPRRHLP